MLLHSLFWSTICDVVHDIHVENGLALNGECGIKFTKQFRGRKGQKQKQLHGSSVKEMDFWKMAFLI